MERKWVFSGAFDSNRQSHQLTGSTDLYRGRNLISWVHNSKTVNATQQADSIHLQVWKCPTQGWTDKFYILVQFSVLKRCSLTTWRIVMIPLVLTQFKARVTAASLPCAVTCGSTGWAGWREGWMDGVGMGCPAPRRALTSWNRHQRFRYYVWVLSWRLRPTIHPNPAYNTEEEGKASRKARVRGVGCGEKALYYIIE